MPNVRHEPVYITSVALTPTEYTLLAKSARCNSCGHLLALHGDHPCEYCSVPGCRCLNGVWNDSNPPMLP